MARSRPPLLAIKGVGQQFGGVAVSALTVEAEGIVALVATVAHFARGPKNAGTYLGREPAAVAR